MVARVGMKLRVEYPPPLEMKGFLARKQVQEPGIKRPRKVAVLIPVGGEPGRVMRPALLDTD